MIAAPIQAFAETTELPSAEHSMGDDAAYDLPSELLDENGPDDDSFSDDAVLLEGAGQNGSYVYDLETEEETFVPPDAFDFVPEETTFGGTELDTPWIQPFYTGPYGRQRVSTVGGISATTCLLVARYPDNSLGEATGWLLNGRTVVTAGHVLYSHGHGGRANHVAVYVGNNGGSYKEYRLGTSFEIGGDFIDYQSLHDDWGILGLKDPVSGSYTYMGFKAANSLSDMKNHHYYSYGYPFDLNKKDLGKTDSQLWSNLTQMYMYQAHGQTSHVTDADEKPVRNLLQATMNMDAESGQSGACIHRIDAATNRYVAQGIISAEDSRGSYIVPINNWLYNKLASKF